MNDLTVTLNDDERMYVSLALAQLIDGIEDVPEVNLEDLLELHSKFLMPEDIIIA